MYWNLLSFFNISSRFHGNGVHSDENEHFSENQGSLWKISFPVLTVSVQIIIKYLAIVVINTLLNQHGIFHINAYCNILLAVIF